MVLYRLFLVSVSIGLGNFAASIGIGMGGVDGKLRYFRWSWSRFWRSPGGSRESFRHTKGKTTVTCCAGPAKEIRGRDDGQSY